MHRHLISEENEWITEIPTVQAKYIAKKLPRERAWPIKWGKKTILSLILVRSARRTGKCSIGGRPGALGLQAGLEIPP